MSESTLVFETGYADVGPGELVLTAASGRQRMSTIYEYELTLQAQEEGGLAPEDCDGLLSNNFSILQTRDESSIEVHGVLRELRYKAATGDHPPTYHAILVPHFWNTTRSFRTRIYQDMDVRELITEVLSLNSLEADWWLSESYPKCEYIVQYQESDFDFISRQLEHWGIFYYFRQEPDGDVLVICDDERSFNAVDGFDSLTFNPRSGRSNAAGSVHSIGAILRPQAASLTAREYNYRFPSIELLQQTQVDSRSGLGFQWLYGDHFKEEGDGETIARIRAEQLLNRRETIEGVCSVPGLVPGHKFDLLDSPVPDLNITYLVTSIEHSLTVTGDQGDEAYQYAFTAVPLERDDPAPVPYRSQRSTPKPRIAGFMHGKVDGEVPGTAAPIDHEGRYKIVMPMDSASLPGGHASRWIRMLQPYSGENYGMHFPLHIGAEVAIIHLDGDPDRPLILGSAPNPDTMSPVNREEATKNRIKTRSGVLIEINDDTG